MNFGTPFVYLFYFVNFTYFLHAKDTAEELLFHNEEMDVISNYLREKELYLSLDEYGNGGIYLFYSFYSLLASKGHCRRITFSPRGNGHDTRIIKRKRTLFFT